MNSQNPVTLLWFRKGLRLHDSPALHAALEHDGPLCPVFILDPALTRPEKLGINRMAFLLGTLHALHKELRARGSRLYVLRGEPLAQLEWAMQIWRVDRLVFEADTEPYAVRRDEGARALARRLGVEVSSPGGHTLHDPGVLLEAAGGTLPTTYGGFQKLLARVGEPPVPLATPEKLPPIPLQDLPNSSVPVPLQDLTDSSVPEPDFSIPTLLELGYSGAARGLEFCLPGEVAALEQMRSWTIHPQRVAAFEKPSTDPSSYAPAATTRLSAHLKFGSLSSRTFYHQLRAAEHEAGRHSQPPMSLVGQLLWREMFTTLGAATPNYDRMVGNRLCRQIPWDSDAELLEAWNAGRTGYPWIDASMRQLECEGWMHHLARHSVACFLTRGDLWQSWEAGQATFDRLLIDADWSLNAANWMWLSASAFFTAYERVYSPVAFPKKYAGSRAYIRHYLPELERMPDKYLLEPWTAPLEVQRQAGCVVGRDYPLPIVEHAAVRERNLGRMKAAYAAGRLLV